MRCPHCNESNLPSSTFCHSCGKVLSLKRSSQQPPPFKPMPSVIPHPVKQKSTTERTWAIGGSLVGIIALLAVIYLAATGTSKTRTPTVTNNARVAAIETDIPPTLTWTPEATDTPTPIPATATPEPTATLLQAGNFRTGPGVVFDIIRQLPAGTSVILKQTREEAGERWYYVTTEKQSGWIHGSLLPVDPAIISTLKINQIPYKTPTPPPTPRPKATAKPVGQCDPSYPGVCIPQYPPDLDCGDIPYRRFVVRDPDLHNFDSDYDGIGCES